MERLTPRYVERTERDTARDPVASIPMTELVFGQSDRTSDEHRAVPEQPDGR